MDIMASVRDKYPAYLLCKKHLKIYEFDGSICPVCGERIARNHSMSLSPIVLMDLRRRLKAI